MSSRLRPTSSARPSRFRQKSPCIMLRVGARSRLSATVSPGVAPGMHEREAYALFQRAVLHPARAAARPHLGAHEYIGCTNSVLTCRRRQQRDNPETNFLRRPGRDAQHANPHAFKRFAATTRPACSLLVPTSGHLPGKVIATHQSPSRHAPGWRTSMLRKHGPVQRM